MGYGLGNDNFSDRGDVHALYRSIVESRNESAFNKMMREPPSIKPIQIKGKEDVIKYLEMAAVMEEIPCDDHLIIILSLSDYGLDKEYQSLVFYEDGFIAKTDKQSGTIMKRLFTRLGIQYDWVRSMVNLMEGKKRHCIPYVYGKTCFLPIDGPSKKHVTWVSLSHIVDYQKVASAPKSDIRFEFRNRHQLIVTMRYLAFENHLASAAMLYRVQYQHYYHVSKVFGMRVELRDLPISNSVLQKKISALSCDREVDIEDMIKLQILSTWREMAHDSPLKDYPMINELHETLLDKYSPRS